MQYVVQTVEDHEMPEGVDRVIVERDGEPPVLLISGDAARCWELMRAWEDSIEPPHIPTICVPMLRAV